MGIAAECLHLGDAQRLEQGVVRMVHLHEDMRHALGDLHRHTRSTQVLAASHVLKPLLLLIGFRSMPLEPSGVHGRGNCVASEQMPRQRLGTAVAP